jgi:hypothetical protein
MRTSVIVAAALVILASAAHEALAAQIEPAPQAAAGGAKAPGHTKAVVCRRNGVPTLLVNGQPFNGMAYAAYDPLLPVLRDFTRVGVKVFSVPGTPTEARFPPDGTWSESGKYDFSKMDRRVKLILEANPQAYFFPRLDLYTPVWWRARHPDDLATVDPGDGKPVPFRYGVGGAPSWASPAWRKDTVEGLRRLIAHVESSAYADRCIGYHIASGISNEWFMWDERPQHLLDYSPANAAAFRQWLRAKYGTTGRLQKAWGDSAVTFNSAAIPPTARRSRAELGVLRDPAKEQAVIDYYLFYSEMVADTICYLAKAVKEFTKGEKIIGAFYGYTLQLCGPDSGHLALGRVLDSPDVDFLCSPSSYAFRQVGGEGTSHFMAPLASVQLHGKLWFDENDIRTSITGGQLGRDGMPANLAGDILQQDKELANVLTAGAAQWWFDVAGNRYDHPVLSERLSQLTANASAALRLDRSPMDQVAMVIDERSLCYLRRDDPLGGQLLVQQLPALARIGAPVGHYLVSDLPRIADRKVFLMMNSFAPTAADRAAIDALKRNGHVLVFFYAPGLYRDGKLCEEAMTDFTGIKLRMTTARTELRVKLKPGHALTNGLERVAYGVGPASPTCYADDPAATVLGTLPDGRAGLVIKPQSGWTAVYSAAPLLPAALLRRIAGLGGVHQYIESEDVVWASREMLAVSVFQPGKRRITLPRPARVWDLYSGRLIAESADSFEVSFAPRATRLFTIRP